MNKQCFCLQCLTLTMKLNSYSHRRRFSSETFSQQRSFVPSAEKRGFSCTSNKFSRCVFYFTSTVITTIVLYIYLSVSVLILHMFSGKKKSKDASLSDSDSDASAEDIPPDSEEETSSTMSSSSASSLPQRGN